MKIGNRPPRRRALAAAVLALAAAGGAQAASNPMQGDWTRTLQPRDINHDGTVDAWYDTVLDITWLADANYAGTLRLPSVAHLASGTGRLTFDEARTWIGGLSVMGVTGWRLPKEIVPGNFDCMDVRTACRGAGYDVPVLSSELAHLFYATLGNTAAYNGSGQLQTTTGRSNDGPFINMLTTFAPQGDWAGDYAPWYTGTVPDFGAMTPNDWRFSLSSGRRSYWVDTIGGYSWPVHDGDIGALSAPPPPPPVPEPGRAALMLAGLAGLVIRRVRQRRAD